jgi:hypothetical protein
MSLDTETHLHAAASPQVVRSGQLRRYANGRSGFALHRSAVRPHRGSCDGLLAVVPRKQSVFSTLTLHTQQIEAAVPSGIIASRAEIWIVEAGRPLHRQSMKADRYAPSRVSAANRAEA